MNSKMKNLILVLFLFMNCIILHGQEKPQSPLRPYSEFAPDSVEYIKANFTRNHSYDDLPISTLLNDLEVEFKTIEVCFGNDGWIREIAFYVQTPEQVEEVVQKGEWLKALRLASPVGPDNQPLFDAIRQGHTSDFIMPWCDDYIKAIRDDLKPWQTFYY